MNTNIKFDTIDDLFAAAQAEEHAWVDDNFTKMVINQLPASPNRVDTKGISLDVVATLIGGIIALVFVDFNAVINRIWGQGVDASGQLLSTWVVASTETASLVPMSSPLLMTSIALVVIAASAIAAWVMVEKPSWIRG